MFAFFALVVLLFRQALAFPAPPVPVVLRARDAVGTTALSADQLKSFAPFTQFARAAYCPPDKIMNWKCGEACDALPGFVPTIRGGDGNGVQFYYVGHWPASNSIVVAHQGTDPLKFLSLLTDLQFLPETLDPKHFPGIPDNIKVHQGFREAHYDTASAIMNETQRLVAEKSSKQVIVIGHSLGGAIAELDVLMMRLNLPADVAVKGVTYGTPRVGTPEFAKFFDEKITDFSRVNNDNDPIPTLPGRFLGFSHPHGEVHIIKEGKAVACPGDEADQDDCSNKVVSNVLLGNILDHLGKYDGISLGTLFCK